MNSTQRLCLYMLVMLFGFIALGTHSEAGNPQLIGIVIIVIGVAGIGGELNGFLRRRFEAQLSEQEREERRRVRTARRSRADQRKEALRNERDRAAAAEERQKLRAMAAAAARAGEAQAQETLRNLRDEQIAFEAARIAALNDADFAAGAAALYVKRGWSVETPDAEAPFDLVLTRVSGDGSRAVSRCVPVGRAAEAADLLALESWRESAKAEHAFLVSAAGFSESCVLQTESMKQRITLVEPHLMAQWLAS